MEQQFREIEDNNRWNEVFQVSRRSHFFGPHDLMSL
jgi:hypothetical protein